jgi:hypothetical protein
MLDLLKLLVDVLVSGLATALTLAGVSTSTKASSTA